MATGIFNTARVAGEGITLAIVSAVLAALVESSLRGVLPMSASHHTSDIAEAAQRVTAGDLVHAAAAWPDVGRTLFVSGYADAFQSLLHILTAITVLSALATFGFLGRTRLASGEPGEPGEPTVDSPRAANQQETEVKNSEIAVTDMAANP